MPNGRVFLKNKKTINLPPNKTASRTYRKWIDPCRQGRSCRQRGGRIKFVLRKAYNLGKKKTINSSVGKLLIREGLKYAPSKYKKGTKRIKKNRFCFLLQLDLANYAADWGTRLARQRCT